MVFICPILRKYGVYLSYTPQKWVSSSFHPPQKWVSSSFLPSTGPELKFQLSKKNAPENLLGEKADTPGRDGQQHIQGDAGIG